MLWNLTRLFRSLPLTKIDRTLPTWHGTWPKRIYNPITAMGFSGMFTFQLDNTKRWTLPAPHCRNGSCRYVRAMSCLLPFSFFPAKLLRKILKLHLNKKILLLWGRTLSSTSIPPIIALYIFHFHSFENRSGKLFFSLQKKGGKSSLKIHFTCHARAFSKMI